MSSVSFQSLSTLHVMRMQMTPSKIGLPVQEAQLPPNHLSKIYPIPIRGEHIGYSPHQLNLIDRSLSGVADSGLSAIGTQLNLLV